MTLRLHVAPPGAATTAPGALVAGAEIELPPLAARHAQVRRIQPGDPLVLFDGHGLEWPAEVLEMGRGLVRVRLGAPRAMANELPQAVTLAFVMPANERMDALVEKATELGAAALQPLVSERSVLRLAGEREVKRRAHWQAVAVAACEQCGRARVPPVRQVLPLADWLGEAEPGRRWLLSTRPGATPIASACQVEAAGAAAPQPLVLLSGPEGGFSVAEEAAAIEAGFTALTLGPRILRADTAPLAVLAWIGLAHPVLVAG